MRILMVEDDRYFRERMINFCQLEGIETAAAENGLSAKRLLEEEIFDAVVTDLNLPGMTGLELLTWIQEEGPSLPVIMMSGCGDIYDAVEAMKRGAQDYLVKPFDFDEFLIRLKRLVENRRFQDQVEVGKRQFFDHQNWIGESLAMQKVSDFVQHVAPTSSTILITGESGTGKEVIARAIHRLSHRAQKPFVAVNMGGVPETLLESELFGYEKGAFTGAGARKLGMFELASSGTLFLDEIGDIPVHLQIKLLRVLQERKIQRLGGTQSIPIDVRIITATNKNLKEQLKKSLFREDLYYRLNVLQVTLPPLRDRKEDIPLLVGHFIKQFTQQEGKPLYHIDPEAIRMLQTYPFPGNVRELENMLERAIILAQTETITLKDLGIHPSALHPASQRGTLEEIQKQAIIEALQRWEGNKTRAAEELGIHRRTILNKLKEYGLTEFEK